MPIFIAALMGAFMQGAVSIVGRVLLSFGIGLITMTGVSASLDFLKNQISSSFGALPAYSLSVLSAAHAGQCVAIVVSAVAARLLFDGMSSAGVIRRWGVT